MDPSSKIKLLPLLSRAWPHTVCRQNALGRSGRCINTYRHWCIVSSWSLLWAVAPDVIEADSYYRYKVNENNNLWTWFGGMLEATLELYLYKPHWFLTCVTPASTFVLGHKVTSVECMALGYCAYRYGQSDCERCIWGASYPPECMVGVIAWYNALITWDCAIDALY